MEEDIEHMTTTPQFVFGLENILNELVKNNSYQAQIGNTIITYNGILEDTLNGKREVFYITRKVKW